LKGHGPKARRPQQTPDRINRRVGLAANQSGAPRGRPACCRPRRCSRRMGPAMPNGRTIKHPAVYPRADASLSGARARVGRPICLCITRCPFHRVTDPPDLAPVSHPMPVSTAGWHRPKPRQAPPGLRPTRAGIVLDRSASASRWLPRSTLQAQSRHPDPCRRCPKGRFVPTPPGIPKGHPPPPPARSASGTVVLPPTGASSMCTR
jgi:hypothetical protein